MTTVRHVSQCCSLCYSFSFSSVGSSSRLQSYVSYTIVCVHFIVCSMYTFALVLLRHFPVLQIPDLQIQLSRAKLELVAEITSSAPGPLRWDVKPYSINQSPEPLKVFEPILTHEHFLQSDHELDRLLRVISSNVKVIETFSDGGILTEGSSRRRQLSSSD